MKTKLVGLRVERTIQLDTGKGGPGNVYSSVRVSATPYFELEDAKLEDLAGLFSDTQAEIKAAMDDELKPFLPYVVLYRNEDDDIRVQVEELFLGKPVEKD